MLSNKQETNYFGKDNTKQGYINFFNQYGNSDNVTPKSYAQFTLDKISDINVESIKLTNTQINELNNLINDDNPTFDELCNILNCDQLAWVGW